MEFAENFPETINKLIKSLIPCTTFRFISPVSELVGRLGDTANFFDMGILTEFSDNDWLVFEIFPDFPEISDFGKLLDLLKCNFEGGDFGNWINKKWKLIKIIDRLVVLSDFV